MCDFATCRHQIISFLVYTQFTSRFLEGLPVIDCVIACPSYFDDAQRRALLNAAKLAELKGILSFSIMYVYKYK